MARRSSPTPTVPTQTETKPVIEIVGGKLPEMVDKAESALLESGCPIYQRGGMLVRVVTGGKAIKGVKRDLHAVVIQPVEIAYLCELFTKIAVWAKFDARTQQYKNVDCPKIVAETYMARGTWQVPALTGIIETPTLREDGSILQKPGYDEETGLFFHTGTTQFAAIPENPTRQDAIKAAGVFRKLFSTFPFLETIDFSTVLSATLTALIRRSIRSAPMFGLSSPVMGAGKSLLADVIAMIATGRCACFMSQAETPEEEKKRLLAILMEADSVVVIDNIEKPLSSDALCSILTQTTWKERLLGKNKTVTVQTSTTFLATGNNLTFQGDLSTRTLMCVIDPKCEHPEERSFTTNLYKYVPEHRSELVIAALTILRAYHVAGRPKQNIPTFGRFEEWSDWVRSAIIWLGLPDPCETRRRVENNDPVRANLRALLTNWHQAISKPVTLKELMDIARNNEALQNALLEFAAEKHDHINLCSLGRKLKSVQGRIETGLRLEQYGKRKGFILWRVRSFSS